MTNTLHGARILVTRPAAQAANLCRLIEHAGGVSWRFPTIEISASQPDQSVLLMAQHCDWLIFTSTNAVDFAIKAFNGKMPGFNGSPRIAAVGQATAQALTDAGWQVDCVPVSEFSSEGLLAEAALQDINANHCLIVRGVGGRDKLEQGLRSRGATVSYLEVYRRHQPASDNQALEQALTDNALDAITMTSVEALQNLLAMLSSPAQALLKTLPLIVASERIGASAGQFGFKQIVVSPKPTDAEILETLTTLFNGENSGRRN